MLPTGTKTFTLSAYINLQLFNSSTLQLFNLCSLMAGCTVGHLRQDASGTLVSIYKDTVQRNPPVREVFSEITLECFVKCNSTLAKSRIRDDLCILSSE